MKSRRPWIDQDRSDIVVVFVSKNSVDKRGYAQKEIKLAIDKYEEKLIGDIYLIPVQLDPGEFPHLLSGIQFIGAADGSIDEALLKSIEAASHTAREDIETAQTEAEVRWSVTESKSAYSGIPGYATTVNKLAVSSAKYSNVNEISDHVNGALAAYSMNSRRNSLFPDPTLYNLMQDEWRRTDTFDAIFVSAHVVGRIISVDYSLHWYSAGAAHPVHSPKTFNYLLEPVHHLKELKDLFIDETALEVVKAETERALIETLSGPEANLADVEWIKRGTDSWDCFSNFRFERDRLSFQFPSYQVACYAAGMPIAMVPYSALKQHFGDAILYALNLYR